MKDKCDVCQVSKSWEILGTLYTKLLIVTKTYKILVLQLHLQVQSYSLVLLNKKCQLSHLRSSFLSHEMFTPVIQTHKLWTTLGFVKTCTESLEESVISVSLYYSADCVQQWQLAHSSSMRQTCICAWTINRLTDAFLAIIATWGTTAATARARLKNYKAISTAAVVLHGQKQFLSVLTSNRSDQLIYLLTGYSFEHEISSPSHVRNCPASFLGCR